MAVFSIRIIFIESKVQPSTETLHSTTPAMPASPIAGNYPLNKQWAPLAVYGKRAPIRRKLRGQHKLTLFVNSYAIHIEVIIIKLFLPSVPGNLLSCRRPALSSLYRHRSEENTFECCCCCRRCCCSSNATVQLCNYATVQLCNCATVQPITLLFSLTLIPVFQIEFSMQEPQFLGELRTCNFTSVYSCSAQLDEAH